MKPYNNHSKLCYLRTVFSQNVKKEGRDYIHANRTMTCSVCVMAHIPEGWNKHCWPMGKQCSYLHHEGNFICQWATGTWESTTTEGFTDLVQQTCGYIHAFQHLVYTPPHLAGRAE